MAELSLEFTWILKSLGSTAKVFDHTFFHYLWRLSSPPKPNTQVLTVISKALPNLVPHQVSDSIPYSPLITWVFPHSIIFLQSSLILPPWDLFLRHCLEFSSLKYLLGSRPHFFWVIILFLLIFANQKGLAQVS